MRALAVDWSGARSLSTQRRGIWLADAEDGVLRAVVSGLTRAEAAFLGEIVKGDGLQAAADRLGVSLATARTHLRHVFEKTGTQRQAELVGLMVLGQTTLREDV